MSDLETESGPSLRDHIESAVASHSSSPDVESVVNGAVEHRDREVREKARGNTALDREGRATETRRAQIREAVVAGKAKAATGSVAPPKPGEAPIGAPPTWSKDAAASWKDLPQEVRLAELRQHAELKPHLERLDAIDKVAAPHRERFQKYGLKSEAEAFGRLLEWESHLSNPATQKQAALNLIAQYGLNPHELAAMAGGAPQSNQPQQHDPQLVQAANSQISQFAKGRDHFDKVRETMGALIQARASRYVTANGSINLDKAYADACRAEGLTEGPRSRAVPSSPRGASEGRRAGNSSNSVGDSLRAAFAAARG